MKKFTFLMIVGFMLAGCTHIVEHPIEKKHDETKALSCSELTQDILIDFANGVGPKGDKDYSGCKEELIKLPHKINEGAKDLYKNLPYIAEEAREEIIKLDAQEKASSFTTFIKEQLDSWAE